MWSVTTGQPVCPRCRRPGEAADPRGWGRLREWLVHGDARPRMRCDNGHTWVAGTRTGLYRATSGWNLPGRLLRVLLDRRMAQPIPLFMLGVALVGVLLGVVLDVALGWPWWLTALLAPAVVWLAFLATAFSRSERRGLWTDLMGQISPGRGRALDRQRVRRLLANAPSPPLGLAGWDGTRSIGGSGTSRDQIDSVELVHGERPAGPYLAVTTTWRKDHDRLPHRRDLAPTGGGRRWQPITLRVDGVARPFTYLAIGDGWVARAQLADVVIELAAVGIDVGDVALEPVADLDGYD